MDYILKLHVYFGCLGLRAGFPQNLFYKSWFYFQMMPENLHNPHWSEMQKGQHPKTLWEAQPFFKRFHKNQTA